ncbi:E3 ubiquitin-protein ligase listerin isoform X3 [Lolium perenne]|uniref:E3 ubiquitin-protein ligase listerin isoform X3 n=1 Tax=Lolium perenne TaxID=4522 RepID=UPI0021F69BCB|nr:E3 ubiquitin-protein ligase listerin-like isoform X3 [Lolium perenne]
MGKSRGRASSSGVPVVGFGGYHGASRVEPAADSDGSVRLPPDVDAEVLQHLRRLGRKDPTTKLKALSTLSMLFAQKPGEEVVQIVPQWAFEYKRLLLDYNRDVRRATNDTMASLVSAVKKGLAPHLKSLMGPWWFSQFDPATEVAQAGRRSFEAAFPQSDRRMDALMLCVKETFLYLNENLKLTTQALSDKVTPMDELEDMHERVISSSLLAMATLIDILLGVKLQSDGGDSMNTESKSHSKVRSATLSSAEAALSMHKYFINFLRSKSAVIRSATYTLLTSYVKYVPNVFNEEAMKILSSTLLGAFSEKSYVEPYLSLFDADFVPWCLDGKYSTCSSKIDLLLSLIQEECFFDQWCLIIKQTRAKEKQSVDHKISHTKDQFELLTLILQKVRERIAGGKMKNLQRSGSLPEHWRHDLLDSVAVSVFCDLPATDSHVHFLCAALGGSSQDDQICFLSAEAVCKIRGSILKSLASVLITSTFEWTKSSRFLLLPMEHEHSKILGEQSLSANLEIAQLAFQVLERSLFALNTHEEYSVFSHILSALFIIEWECSMALVLAEESDLKGHKEEINVEALMCNTSDDHLDETVHLKANLAERIHAFRQSLIPSFWNDLHSGTLNKLVNILAQSVRYAVFDTVDLPIDRTAVLCSEWVVDMLRLICLDHIKLQSFFDALLSEGEYWPLWVKPSLQNGHASVKIQREPLTTDGTELKHQRFVAFVDKLVLNLSFGEVILAPLSSFSRAWVAAEMICTWNWKGGSAFSTFLPSLVQYMKTEPGLEVSFVSLLLDTLLEGALMHESSDWALFNSWHLSDSEIEKIQDRFLRSLVALLFTAYTKESVLRESDAHVLFEQLRSSLLIGSAVNRKCLRTLPFVMSTIIKPLTEKVRLNEASPCTDLLGKSILSWLEEAISSLSSSPREVAQQDIEDWMQVVLSCFPLKITGGTSKLIVKFEREISDAETSLLLTLFSRYQTFYGSADPSLSSRETILSKTVELLGVKLTAVMVGYCWTKLGETDWCFVFHILRKWIESSVLLVEEMTDNINDAAVNQTSAQDILEKLKLIACTMEDLTFTFAESALVTLCHLNLVDNLHETDNSPNLQLIRSGEYAESNDKMMENILRLFLASGVSEAIAGSCSEEASSIIASSRVDHLHFWELVASFIIDASPQIRRSALDSMKLWGLTKEPVNGLYSILFSSEPISHLQFAAYSLLMSEPLCQLSLVKGSSVGEIGEIPLSSQESEVGQNIESIPDSEKALYLRDELTALIEMPTSELVKTDLVALERVNVFVAWALVLSHLQLLPLSSATREKVLQYVQDKISPSILDCIFQHIPLKTAAPSGKKKDVELMPEARAAAEASKGAITTCSLLPYVESLWPVGVLQMASLAGSLYGMMIRLLPSYVRTWFTSLRDRSLSYSIESFTRAWCSPPLLLDEFSQGGEYQSTADETPVNCDSAWHNSPSSYESTLFHGIETSLTQSEVDILCKSFPEEIVATTHWEPGSILIYEATMHSGFTMPLHPFIASIVNAFGISPAQLLKHGWLAMQTFLTQCDEKQLKPSVDSFLYFFSIFKSRHKYDDRDHYSFKTRESDIMKVSKAEKIRTGRHEKMEWHKRFFFIKSKSNEGWLFPEKWARGGPLSKKCQLTEEDQKVVKALGGNPTADECLSPVSAPSPALGSSLPKEVDDQEVSKALGGNPSADHCLPPVPALPAALASSLPKEQRIEKSVECSRRMQNIELQKRIDNLEQVLEKQAIQMKNICQQHENDKKRWETERKNTFTTIEALGNIRVFCRCRPLSKLEASLGFKTAVDFDGADDGELRIIEGKSRRLFKFDRVYAPDDDQAKVFSDASSLVTSVLDGYNVCILAYGQTGTGKTFTMEGTEQNRGVNYRTLRELFSLTDNKKQLFQYNIYVSMLEVYNENIRDLLSPSMASPTKLEIKTASDGSHYIRGIAEREVDNIDDAWDILLSGSNSRAVGSTDVNEHSSRSHSMLCITVSANNLINNVCTKSKLWLVDLAGSERNAKTGAQGDRLEEAKNINRSLSALGNVIAALASGHSHIPYRDSKLTYLLQDFLGGDSKALLLVQISPSDNDLAETIDTLKFAERAMGVELGPAKRQKGYLAVRGGGVHEAGLGAAATPGADAGRHASAAGRHHGPLSEAFHRRRQGLAAAGN